MAPSQETTASTSSTESKTINKEIALKHDVSNTIIGHLDPHLAFRALKSLEQKNIYSKDDMKRAKLEVLKKTYMIDEAKDIYQDLYPDSKDADGLDQQRQEILSRLKTIKSRVQNLLKIVEDEDLVNKLRDENKLTFEHLKEEYNITEEEVEELYAHAKARYECGDYSGAVYYLEVYRRICPDESNARQAQWGQLAAQLLVPDWDQATELLKIVRDNLGERDYRDQVMHMQRRAWLLHWSLFLLAHHPPARSTVIDLFAHDIQNVQPLASHLLRHFIVAVFTEKRLRQQMSDTLKSIVQYETNNTDPVVQFILNLLVDYDFDAALNILPSACDVIRCDVFLDGLEEEFKEGAMFVLCETYCRLHRVVDLEVLAKKLDMDVHATEQFMANVIRSSKLHAKIDSNRNLITVDMPPPNVYQQVLARTEDIQQRNNTLRYLLKQHTRPTSNKRYDKKGPKRK